MAGGIQPGTKASSEASEKIDKQVRSLSQVLSQELISEGYADRVYRHSKIPKEFLFKGIGACQPDGGVWFRDKQLVAAFEAKHKAARGNAIERWYKNKEIIQSINPDCPLLTFATGEGVLKGNPIWTILHHAVRGEFNQLRESGPSVFLSQNGFSEYFLRGKMREYLELKLSRLNS